MSANKILVWAEIIDGDVTGISYELLGLARRLAAKLDGSVAAVILGPDAKQHTEILVGRGADCVYVVDEPVLETFHTDTALAALTLAYEKADPALFLFPHSSYGSELAPRLAFRIGSSPAMGCLDGHIDNGQVKMTRPCYGGRARSKVGFGTTPAIATILAKSQEAPAFDAQRQGEIVILDQSLSETATRIKVLKRTPNPEQGVRLDEATIVISGGRGIGGAEGFRVLEELAEAIGGAVGASRPACDMGWYPHSHQVGVSGRTVAPELYIAVGISGAGHHLAGCGNAKVLVAINSDPDARIFEFAHLGIVVDYQDVLPEMLRILRG